MDTSNRSNYIGPGMDLVFQSSSMLMGLMISLLVFLGLIGKRIFGFFKGKKKIIFLLLAAIAVVVFYYGAGDKEKHMRVIVIGIDGFDPGMIERMMEDGNAPNFKSLREQGDYARLETTNPPQSPVAWASFITGSNPGKHGVFDFIKRDPRTYLPDLAMVNETRPRFVTIGKMKIPLGSSKLAPNRKGTAFWDITSKHKIPTYIYRCPLTFPAEKVHGRMLSGLGTPDLCGTQGTFSFYTTKKDALKAYAGGRIKIVSIIDGTVKTKIAGPRNLGSESRPEYEIPLEIKCRNDNGIELVLQDQKIALQKGQWSPWVRIAFTGTLYSKIHGICRFYLKETSPEFELYMSPINFDPDDPAFAITYPRSFSKILSKEIGIYHTLGQAGDTWALNEGRITEEAALQQYSQVLDEDKKVLMNELEQFKHGVFFFYFGISDTVQHMFYQNKDAGSLHAKQYGNTIKDDVLRP